MLPKCFPSQSTHPEHSTSDYNHLIPSSTYHNTASTTKNRLSTKMIIGNIRTIFDNHLKTSSRLSLSVGSRTYIVFHLCAGFIHSVASDTSSGKTRGLLTSRYLKWHVQRNSNLFNLRLVSVLFIRLVFVFFRLWSSQRR